MFSFVHNIARSNMNDKNQEAINQGCKAVNREEVNSLNLQNSPGNADDLQFHRGPSVEIPQEGYGKAPRSGESYRCSPYKKKKTGNQALADLITRDFVNVGEKEGDCLGAMFQMARNHRTEPRGNIKEILERRAKLYDDNLDPKWFSYDSDLGVKAKSSQERNTARAMLAAAPLMMAQQGALDLRKRMIEGDSSILSGLRLEDKMTVAQVLSKLKAVPPLTILKLCNKEVGDFVMDNLLQHSDDLDFVQDVLDLVGLHSALTPTLHTVLAGFSRRKNHGRFKYGQMSIAMDRLIYARLASPKDKDNRNVIKRKERSKSGNCKDLCHHFQRRTGCRDVDGCQFEHSCIICGKKSHGAFCCKARRQGSAPPKGRRKDVFSEDDKRGSLVPVHRRRPRSR